MRTPPPARLCQVPPGLEPLLRLYLLLCFSQALVSSATAADWFWVNDLGGTWDEEMAGSSSWRDSADDPGLPGNGDNVLMALPYSFSFPGFTQPVVVNYRSDLPLELNTLVIESENWLVQDTALGATRAELFLSSETELIGGSGWSFNPPASFPLPDPPGIFPKGRHLQRAGTNQIHSRLTLGATAGGEGTYELSDNGLLLIGTATDVGDAGTGSFLQSGGRHTGGELILGRQAGGVGTYTLSDMGSLKMRFQTVGNSGHGHFIQTGGTNTLTYLYLAENTASEGIYELSGGVLSSLGGAMIGRHGTARFHQIGGTFDVSSELRLGRDPEGNGTFLLEGGQLRTHGWTLVGSPGRGTFTQTGGRHDTPMLIVSSPTSTATNTGLYALQSGTLNAQQVFVNANGFLVQTGGVHRIAERLEIASPTGPSGEYHLQDGLLEVGSVSLPTAEVVIDGRLEQSGNASQSLIYGNCWIGSGGYSLDAGYLEISGDLVLGHAGWGTFRQDGGESTVNRVLLGTTTSPGSHVGYLYIQGGVLRVRDRIVAENSQCTVGLNRGTIETDAILNHGLLDWRGGNLTRGSSPVDPPGIENYGEFAVGSPDLLTAWVDLVNWGETRIRSDLILRGRVVNRGTFKVDDLVQLAFIDHFVNRAEYHSDPATSVFQDGLEITESGYLVGETKDDRFIIEGDFLNNSRQSQLWSTDNATLILAGNGTQKVELPGEDRGYSSTARENNFAWGILEIRAGATAEFIDGNPDNAGTAMYVGILDIQDRSQIDVDTGTLGCFSGDVSFFYDPTRPENSYLQGREFSFVEGSGRVATKVPAVSVNLAINDAGDGFHLSFATNAGVDYAIFASNDLSSFSRVDTTAGTGKVEAYSAPLPNPHACFFTVTPVSATSAN